MLYGVSPARYDEHVLAKERVRYVGDEVAAVAAVDEATAERALELIEVEYEELPAVFDPFEAMKDGAPRDPRGPAVREQHQHQGRLALRRRGEGLRRGRRGPASSASSATAPTRRRSSPTAASPVGAPRRASSPSGPRRRCPTTSSTMLARVLEMPHGQDPRHQARRGRRLRRQGRDDAARLLLGLPGAEDRPAGEDEVHPRRRCSTTSAAATSSTST